MARVTRDSRVRRGDEVLHREVGGEAVLVDLGSGRYFGLDEVGTQVWAGMERETSVAALVERVAAEFAVEPERAEKDLIALLRDMAKRGLVKVRAA